jgi:hypothetical protein
VKPALKYLILSAVIANFACSLPALAQNAPGVTVLELFTSGGCADTPPADTVFRDIVMQNQPNVIAWACHLTYFDAPDTANPFSTEDCNDRYSFYMQHSTDVANIPALVMNGVFHMEGTHPNIIAAGIKMSRAQAKISRIQIRLQDNALFAALPTVNAKDPLEIWLITYQRGAARTPDKACGNPQYANYARHAEKIFQWDGQATEARIDLSGLEPAEGYALIAQVTPDFEHEPAIIAAGKIELPAPLAP